MWFYIGEKKLSEHQPFMDYVRMLGNELHWVDSNTGSGKTYMMGVRANELNKVLILSPFVALSDNIHTEPLEHVDRSDIKVVSGTNHDWDAKVVVATYDKAVNAPIDLIKSFDCIFIDELQTIYEDEYRKCMSQMMALLSEVKKDLPVIALSATLIEDMLPLFNKISVSRNIEYHPNAKLIPDRKERIDARIIQGCQEAADRNEVYCLLLNNKDTLNDYRQLLEKTELHVPV
ncbi:DEAD/DEAH box helicase [Vibrio parahaemolyticus]|nr:DEAD/DEAH box helicase [Vibrio parahaemolyticus]EGU9030367.1 DEAD/DEAH box helicase [Vibrio parahaemolyticus]EHR0760549.1 DEAD/DEAH box helicase family protein [Vibrio parahaemolyticus]EHR0831256.1 DEAD/DEAH box helicase family protein [Vibrio parahaemolyticus]EHR1158875.1 DEAD/DEAH box helicase family protein [Vibrio parahaemolyticus]